MDCFLCKEDGGIYCSNKHMICLNCLFEIFEKNYDEWLKNDELLLENDFQKYQMYNPVLITNLLDKHIKNLIDLGVVDYKKKRIFWDNFGVNINMIIQCPICKELKKTKKRIFNK
jgi:hypothetical protein